MTSPSSNEPITRRDVLKRAAVGSVALAATGTSSVLATED